MIVSSPVKYGCHLVMIIAAWLTVKSRLRGLPLIAVRWQRGEFLQLGREVVAPLLAVARDVGTVGRDADALTRHLSGTDRAGQGREIELSVCWARERPERQAEDVALLYAHMGSRCASCRRCLRLRRGHIVRLFARFAVSIVCANFRCHGPFI